MGATLDFGKNKGKQMRELDVGYLTWLACYKLIGTEMVTNLDSGWLVQNKLHVIYRARKELIKRRICFHCHRVLPTIGRDRVNGSQNYDDWLSRLLHLKCFKALS